MVCRLHRHKGASTGVEVMRQRHHARRLPTFFFSTLMALVTVTAGCSSKLEGAPVNYSAVIGPSDGAAAFKSRQTLATYNAVSGDDKDTMVNGAGFLLQHGTKVQVLSEAYDYKLSRISSDPRNNSDCFVKRTQAFEDDGEWVDCWAVVPTSAMSAPARPKEMLSLDQAEDVAIKACQSRYNLTFKRMDTAPDIEIGDYPNSDGHLVLINCAHPGEGLWQGNGKHTLFIDRDTHKVTTEDEWFHTTPCKLWDKDRTSIWCQRHPKQ